MLRMCLTWISILVMVAFAWINNNVIRTCLTWISILVMVAFAWFNNNVIRTHYTASKVVKFS